MIRLVDPGRTPAISWLVTYLLHSTLWVGGVWLVAWLLPALPARARSLLWRTALLGPLLSASLQAGAGGSWSVHSVPLDPPPVVAAAPVVIEVPELAPVVVSEPIPLVVLPPA